MNQLQFTFFAFFVVGMFGSLSIFTPKVPWKDLTVFVRKGRKKEYLAYSNRFLGKSWLGIGLLSLALLSLSYFVAFSVSTLFVLFLYFMVLILFRILLEVSWRNHLLETNKQ